VRYRCLSLFLKDVLAIYVILLKMLFGDHLDSTAIIYFWINLLFIHLI